MVGLTGGQREGIIGGVLFRGSRKDRTEAIAKLDAGEIALGACHDFGCVGSLAGIYTASMRSSWSKTMHSAMSPSATSTKAAIRAA